MKIKTREQLDQVRSQCQSLVTMRAVTAGVASAVPGAVTGIAADVGLLLEMLPKINKAFGLDPEQIDALDEQARQQVFMLAGTIGSQVIGRTITKEVVLAAMKAIGVRTSVKAAASWVPLIGSAVAGTLGFGLMKYVGNQHVRECYELVSKLLDNGASDAATE